jgi:hypothetical protein
MLHKAEDELGEAELNWANNIFPQRSVRLTTREELLSDCICQATSSWQDRTCIHFLKLKMFLPFTHFTHETTLGTGPFHFPKLEGNDCMAFVIILEYIAVCLGFSCVSRINCRD